MIQLSSVKQFVKLLASLALGTTLLLHHVAHVAQPGMTTVLVVLASLVLGIQAQVHLAHQAGTVVRAVQIAAVHQAGIKYVDV